MMLTTAHRAALLTIAGALGLAGASLLGLVIAHHDAAFERYELVGQAIGESAGLSILVHDDTPLADDVCDMLVERAVTSDDFECRSAAVESLVRYCGDRGVRQVRRLWQEQSGYVLVSCGVSLSHALGNALLEEPWFDSDHDDDPWRRLAVQRARLELDRAEAIDALLLLSTVDHTQVSLLAWNRARRELTWFAQARACPLPVDTVDSPDAEGVTRLVEYRRRYVTDDIMHMRTCILQRTRRHTTAIEKMHMRATTIADRLGVKK